MQARVWYDQHFCTEGAREDLAYLAVPSLDMTADQLLKWASRKASISAAWAIDPFGEGDAVNESA